MGGRKDAERRLRVPDDLANDRPHQVGRLNDHARLDAHVNAVTARARRPRRRDSVLQFGPRGRRGPTCRSAVRIAESVRRSFWARRVSQRNLSAESRRFETVRAQKGE
jgi:hypothetical protein